MDGQDKQNAARVHAAICANVTAAELRAIIEECANGGSSSADDKERARRRLAAINGEVPRSDWGAEVPLTAAARHFDNRPALIPVLVENGAEVKRVFGQGATPLAVCVSCGDDAEASVRALLRQGADPRAPVGFRTGEYGWPTGFRLAKRTCTAAHLCIMSIYEVARQESSSPSFRCLEALVREGGGGGGAGGGSGSGSGSPDLIINAVDSWGLTPLAWLGDAFRAGGRPCKEMDGWLATLLGLGADTSHCGQGPHAAPPALYWIRKANYVMEENLVRCLRTLAAAGGRIVGVVDGAGDTALIAASRAGLHIVMDYLITELHADVNEPNRVTGELPLTACGLVPRAVSDLMLAGADPNRADERGRHPLLRALTLTEDENADPESLFCPARCSLYMLQHGATTDGVRGPEGEPLLILACVRWPPDTLSDDRARLLEVLLDCTPDADRRFKLKDGRSAVDLIVGHEGEWLDENASIEDLEPDEEWIDSLPGEPVGTGISAMAREAAMRRTIAAHRRMVVDLVLSGASVLESNKAAVDEVIQSALADAARWAMRPTRELRARCSEGRRWRAHDCMVGLALEERDVREADERLRVTRARVAELERAVAEVEGKEDDDEGEEDDEEGEEATTSSGGGTEEGGDE